MMKTMLQAIDKENLERVIKYYGVIEEHEGAEFEIGKTYNYMGFDEIPCYMDDNYSLWAERKEHLFKLFGNKLKIKKELSGENLVTDTMVRRMRINFFEDKKGLLHPLVAMFLAGISTEELKNNELMRNIEFLDVRFKKGDRVTKCFDKLIEDKTIREQQKDLYSTFLQGLKVEGQLVLSIDPLDYITMSVSKSGWSSCHHPSSCHGTGGWSYMVDSVSVVAYVEAKEPMISYVYDDNSKETYEFKMSNKIWRQMVNFSPKLEYALQMEHYPNFSEAFSNEVANIVKELLESYNGYKFNMGMDNIYNENSRVQDINSYAIYTPVFYCDYENNNLDSGYGAIFPAHLGGKDGEATVKDLQNSIYNDEIDVILVGNEFYCACGCGSANYTSKFYVEDATEDDDFAWEEW